VRIKSSLPSAEDHSTSAATPEIDTIESPAKGGVRDADDGQNVPSSATSIIGVAPVKRTLNITPLSEELAAAGRVTPSYQLQNTVSASA
jgi:hypothetical protein